MFASLTDYMDAARSRHELRSDRALGREMDVEQAIVSRWRLGKANPSDDQMIRLAQLAGADPDQAVLLLGVWSARDEPTRDTYRRLLQRFGSGTGLAVAVAASLAIGGPPETGRGWSLSQLAVALIHYYGN
jgi:transcriptional regulator with XRE-family HTH domain